MEKHFTQVAYHSISTFNQRLKAAHKEEFEEEQESEEDCDAWKEQWKEPGAATKPKKKLTGRVVQRTRPDKNAAVVLCTRCSSVAPRATATHM